ncbi:oviduct-specific glycoprotein-like [Anopheles cruzii]|uniref:oviduct-specific glycoprotein-like n=1 Tax=Anopheles cruzii TaxID=68878 RepID=UPI0022EC5D80|nr:oviduct-specific glycoprotein-like [Anopheles cruzii]
MWPQCYRIEDTPLDLCTHVLYFAARTDPESYEIKPMNARIAILEKGYQKFADLKKRRPDEKGWKFDWDERSASPFAYRGNEWIGYENEVSLEEKAYFVDNEDLGGILVVALENDDYKGVCGKKYPLLTALFEAYRPTWSTDDDPFAFAIERSRRDVGPK